MAGAEETTKPLLNKLLAVRSLKQRYLGYIRHIAENWLDWDKIGPLVQQYQSVIAADIEKDTHKLDSTEAFKAGLIEDQGRRMGIKSFVEKRRAYLLGQPEVKNAPLPAKI